jgi:thioredoxin reductase (NADPH)
MAKPVIMMVDDEPQVLNAVERDLRKHFRGEYRLVKATSGAEALTAVKQLKQRNTPLALFLVDQRMPVMTGVEFLEQAIPFYPEARKVLLTAYSDTEAAIASINKVGLDYYLMKPWDPPEERLYPVLDDLLLDWAATVQLPYQGIRVAGAQWSPQSHAVKNYLARNLIPYQWLDIEKDDEARLLVEALEEDPVRLPVVFLPEGATLVQPTNQELAVRLGLYSNPSLPFYDLAIIGAGPAGLAAAVYGASEGLKTVLIEKEATGGQAGTSSRIENYLGFPNGLSGSDLAHRATIQAKRLGAEIITPSEVTELRAEDSYRFIKYSDGMEISCRAVIITTGVKVRRLEAPGVEQLTGAGVYYGAALTEAANYRGQDVFIVGGANSAGQAAIYFANHARTVTMLVRDSSFAHSMSQYLIDQIAAVPNIRPMFGTNVNEVHGAQHLEAVTVMHRETGECQTLPAAAMFIFIGAVPHTTLASNLVERDRVGFIYTGADIPRQNGKPRGWMLKRDPFMLETSCPGIFAAGDARHGSVKRVASAVGEGAVAVALVHQYLKTI